MPDSGPDWSGGCLCGAVTYRVPPSEPSVLHCHCENCRRLSGNFIAGVRVQTEHLAIESAGEALSWYDLGYARYGFCQRCGATLFYRAIETSEITTVMVGTLDDASGLELKAVWYATEAQPHNPLPVGVTHYDTNG